MLIQRSEDDSGDESDLSRCMHDHTAINDMRSASDCGWLSEHADYAGVVATL